MELLRVLRERLNSWHADAMIGDAMLQLAPFLKMYSTYAAKYEVLITLVVVVESYRLDYSFPL